LRRKRKREFAAGQKKKKLLCCAGSVDEQSRCRAAEQLRLVSAELTKLAVEMESGRLEDVSAIKLSDAATCALGVALAVKWKKRRKPKAVVKPGSRAAPKRAQLKEQKEAANDSDNEDDNSDDDDEDDEDGDDEEEDEEIQLSDANKYHLVKGARVFAQRGNDYVEATVLGPSKKADHWALKMDWDGKVLPKQLGEIKVGKGGKDQAQIVAAMNTQLAQNDDLYACEYDCGFMGLFDAVTLHENRCTAKTK
jgi:hypothetical protein